MNLVGNSCIASWITNRILKCEFSNPFTWCIMDFDSSYNSVKYWDDLDFTNYELVKDQNWNFSIIIDKNVKIQYVHYKFNPKYNKPTKIGDDIFYNKIWEYIIEKYDSRVNRMLKYKENPVFFFACAKSADNKRSNFSLEQQKKLVELNSKYKIILSFDQMIKDDRIVTLEQNKNYKGNTLEMAKFLYSELKV